MNFGLNLNSIHTSDLSRNQTTIQSPHLKTIELKYAHKGATNKTHNSSACEYLPN